jgi:predicted TIM-barrel fold metal-dependent hydrolase
MAVDMDNLGSDEATGWTSVRGVVTFLPEPEPTTLFCPIISSDDHYLEPRDLFVARVPARLRDDVPRMEDDEDGVPWWVFDDQRIPIMLSSGAAGRPVSEWSFAPQKFEELRTGVWDVDARVRDMDLNGIWAALNFPSLIWGFAGTALAKLKNAEAGLAAVRAYNDWVIDEWTAAHPERFIPCQMPWLADPATAAEEIRRNAARGFKAVSFSENPEGLGYPGVYSQHWDPFFAACAETGTVLNLHTGSSGSITRPSSSSPLEVLNALFPVSGIVTTIDWIFAKIPLRFPELRIVLSEGGVSWVPMVVERLGRAYRFRDASENWKASDGHPLDSLRQSFWFTSIEDPSAFQQLDLIGRDRVMIEADYPHMDGSWPDTQGLVRGGTQHLDADAIRAVCYGNAASLYRHVAPPSEWLTRSAVGSPAASGRGR